jgi:uncharacterized protein (DUF952 family)
MIYHMLPKAVWREQSPTAPYQHASLESEGFIHCTGDPVLLVSVANHYFAEQPGDFVLLCIDEAKVQPTVQWDQVGEHCFPHIYGPLNLDAVVGTVDFPRNALGKFLLPTELTGE